VYRVYNILLILSGHTRIERQGNDLLEDLRGTRILPGISMHCVAVERVKVQRDKVHAAPDVGVPKFFDELIAVDG